MCNNRDLYVLPPNGRFFHIPVFDDMVKLTLTRRGVIDLLAYSVFLIEDFLICHLVI